MDLAVAVAVDAAVAAAAEADALFRCVIFGRRPARLRTAHSRPPFLRNIPTK